MLYGVLTRYGVAWPSYKIWCCMGFLQDVVLYGALTRYGIVWPSYRVRCCMGLVQAMVLHGVLTRYGVVWGSEGRTCTLGCQEKREASALLDLASKGGTPPIGAKDCWTEPYSYS